MAWTAQDAAPADISGQVPASSGKTSHLRIAASFAAGIPVRLCGTIPRLGHRALNLVTTAIRHTAGRQ